MTYVDQKENKRMTYDEYMKVVCNKNNILRNKTYEKIWF